MSIKKIVLLIVVFTAAAVTIPFIGRAEKAESASNEDLTLVQAVSVGAVPSTSTQDQPQVVSMEVTPSGFQPNEATAPRGKFLILLQNRTGRRDLNFWLARENRERVVESAPEKRDWKAQVQLGPGTYIIGETNHPEWQFTLRVTN